MMKTKTLIEQDFYDAISKTQLAELVSGEIYKSRIRPLNSTAEDIVIISTALNASQLQEGVVTILIYTQGIKRDSNLLPDLERISQIEEMVLTLPSELKQLLPEYDGIRLATAISYALDESVWQYFVSCKINYKFLT